MPLALGHSFTVRDLFKTFNTLKVDYTCEDSLKYNHDPHKKYLAEKIFKDCYKLVLEDVIENNATFNLPTGKQECIIHMKSIKNDDFVKARQRGKFKDIDFLKSNFTGNQLVFEMDSNNRKREKPIYVDETLKQKITDYTNAGKLYC